MRLIRTATINITGLPRRHQHWEARLEAVTLNTMGYFERHGKTSLLVAGEIVLDQLPGLTERNEVIIPPAHRTIESVIELMANMLCVSHRTSRSVSSPYPPVALIPESDDERVWLSARTCFAYASDRRVNARLIPECDLLGVSEQLTDRPDGIALLAEALSQEHASGRFKELIRFFERAFAAATASLIAPLSQYLESAPDYEYDEAEIRHWIVDVRHPLIHADRRNTFLMEADVRHLLPRLEQAAYDVLLNKVTWRSPDIARRRLWTPDAFNRADGLGVFVEKTSPTLETQLLDPLGVYPMNFQVNLAKPPAEWWFRFPSAEERRGAAAPVTGDESA